MLELEINMDISISDVLDTFVGAHTSVRAAMASINSSRQHIALVVDDQTRLIETLTDGDIRRAILGGVNVDSYVSEICDHKRSIGGEIPVTAPVETERSILFKLMKHHSVRQIPLVNASGQVVGLVTIDEVIPDANLGMNAVIMAGGFGKRLYPLTKDTPKPMLPVGDKPLMEHTIQQLSDAGIQNVKISTHYMAEKIVDHFQDGSAFGVNVSYINEDTPMGTAGALSMVEPSNDPLLVLNGDILSNIDYRALLDYHREHQADLTICVRKYEMVVPYGVVECESSDVQRIVEKPSLTFFVNAGIYLLQPEVHRMIPAGERSDMPDLVEHCIKNNRRVVSFPIVEHWLDIGQHADYQLAQEVIKSGSSAE